MAAPVLAFTAIAEHDSSTMDLTALTGGSSGASAVRGWAVPAGLVGSTGAAWLVSAYDTYLYKSGTDGILVPTFFGTETGPGYGGPPGWVQTFQMDDEENNFGHGGADGWDETQYIDGGMVAWGFSGADCGIQWTLPADQKLRLFTYLGYTDGGNWQVEATLSDGSESSSPLNLGGASGVYPNASFTVAWRSVEPDATLLLKIRNPTNSVGGTSALIPRTFLIGVPTPPDQPGTFSPIQMYKGRFGGSN